ncbi:MAG: DUF1858 domain-containing protein [Desulfuromonadaceae bacterium]
MSERLNLTITTLLQRYPEARSVFVAHGLEGLVSEDGLRALAPFLTLGTALRSRGIATESFMRLLDGYGRADPRCAGVGGYPQER